MKMPQGRYFGLAYSKRRYFVDKFLKVLELIQQWIKVIMVYLIPSFFIFEWRVVGGSPITSAAPPTPLIRPLQFLSTLII